MTSSGNFYPPKSEGASVQVHCAHSNKDGKGVIDSVFRTNAWLEAWLDTYGTLANVCILDPFGTGSISDYFYRYKTKTMKMMPCNAIGLAGCQSYGFSSPRAEYNVPECLLNGRIKPQDFIDELERNSWSIFVMPDLQPSEGRESLKSEAVAISECVSYQVISDSVEVYLRSLGKNTRSRYFNKFDRLLSENKVSFHRIDVDCFREFSTLLNGFHVKRWGVACYSELSISMFEQFVRGIAKLGGVAVLEVMEINGAPESVIFDVEWSARRYNLQCGFNESFGSQIKLGSLHIGRSIKESIGRGLVYDMLAGGGKNADYKNSLANSTTCLESVAIYRGVPKLEAWLKQKKRNYLRR